MKKSFLTVLAITLLATFSFAQKKPAAPDTGTIHFEVNGILVIDGQETSNYSFCLHHNGKQLDSGFVKKMKPFEVSLNRNDSYTISYHKDGYTDKHIVIDTHVPKGKAKLEIYELSYEIELNPDKSKHKEEYKDHPVAVIKYVKGKDDFDFSSKYHTEIHHRAKTSAGKGK